MAAQHLTSIRAVSEICGGKLENDLKGSEEVTLAPGNICHGQYLFDVGTAGSVTLVLQAIMPVLCSTPGRSEIVLRGGTDVKWSPPVDYVKSVIFPYFRCFGIECSLEVKKRGYFPKGGGEIHVKLDVPGRLSWKPEDTGSQGEITGIINIGGLRREIADRMMGAIIQNLEDDHAENYDVDIVIDNRENQIDRGVGVVLAHVGEGRFIGVDRLGERGVPADVIGKTVADEFKRYIDSPASMDDHGCDQVMTMMAISESAGDMKILNRTGHVNTNLMVIERFLPGKLNVLDKGKYFILHRNI